MSLEFPSELSDLSPENLRRLNAVCERFEADWRASTGHALKISGAKIIRAIIPISSKS